MKEIVPEYVSNNSELCKLDKKEIKVVENAELDKAEVDTDPLLNKKILQS